MPCLFTRYNCQTLHLFRSSAPSWQWTQLCTWVNLADKNNRLNNTPAWRGWGWEKSFPLTACPVGMGYVPIQILKVNFFFSFFVEVRGGGSETGDVHLGWRAKPGGNFWWIQRLVPKLSGVKRERRLSCSEPDIGHWLHWALNLP